MTTTIRADRQRDVFHIPWLTLFPGLGSFGARKTQAILPGVEYLEDEPSSSEADVRGPLANRRMVDDLKLCFPLMALSHENRFLAVSWRREDCPAALFDSPDRVFDSGAHLLGLWHPGVGAQRLENSLAALDATILPAGQSLTFRCEVIAGEGTTIIPAIQAFVARRGLPDVPVYPGGFRAAVDLLARGWLDSAAHHDGLWRHAVWGDRFPPGPAADADYFQRWLAVRTGDPALATRLRSSADRALERTRGNLDSGASHVRFHLLPHLLHGGIEDSITRARNGASRALGRFKADGSLPYVARAGHPDYASTHHANHANGLGAPLVTAILDACLVANDQDLKRRALALVDQQTALYAESVPRGAQTWECPLHTPDILASGRMVEMYLKAYQLSGAARHLEQARYWACTGVPFVYLDPPLPEPVGLYATIAVFGATNLTAPFWIGLPVQWCGLVYAAALMELAAVDDADGALWRQLATGIIRSGMQQTWTAGDAERQGLLPDFFHLREQRSDGPAIVPGTVGAYLADAFRQEPIFSQRVFGPRRLMIHAPGAVRVAAADRLEITAWPETPWHALLTGLEEAPEVTWNGRPAPVEYMAAHGAAAVLLDGSGTLTVR